MSFTSCLLKVLEAVVGGDRPLLGAGCIPVSESQSGALETGKGQSRGGTRSPTCADERWKEADGKVGGPYESWNRALLFAVHLGPQRLPGGRTQPSSSLDCHAPFPVIQESALS